MNKDTDIRYLIDEYKKLKNDKETKEDYVKAKELVIEKIVNLTNVDYEKCKYILDCESDIILGLLRNIDISLVDDYLQKSNKYSDCLDKISSVNTRLIMILVQITNYKFDRCSYFFENDIDVAIKLLEYIDKLEKR